MLPKSHSILIEEWIDLLTTFQNQWCLQNTDNYYQSPIWQNIQVYLREKIVPFSEELLDSNIARLWQSWQTETHRYIRLLNTDLLFFASAKQSSTRQGKASLIDQHLRSAIALSENLIHQGIGNGE
jgi:hypothetical protein